MAISLTERLDRLAALPPWEWPDDAIDTLESGLADAKKDARATAVGLCGQVLDDRLAKALLTVLKADPEVEIAAQAAVAFAPALEMCDIEGYEPKPGTDEESPPLTQPLFEQVVSALEDLYRDQEKSSLLRRRALEAATWAPRDWQTDATRTAFACAQEEWRATAVYCMGLLPGFTDQILEAIESPQAPVRFEAIRAAGEQEIEAAGPAVLALAKDPATERELRLAAIDALGVITPPGSEEVLDGLVVSADEELAEAAEAALEERL